MPLRSTLGDLASVVSDRSIVCNQVVWKHVLQRRTWGYKNRDSYRFKSGSACAAGLRPVGGAEVLQGCSLLPLCCRLNTVVQQPDAN